MTKTALKEQNKDSNTIYIHICIYFHSFDSAGDFPSSLQKNLASLKFSLKKYIYIYFLKRNELKHKDMEPNSSTQRAMNPEYFCGSWNSTSDILLKGF